MANEFNIKNGFISNGGSKIFGVLTASTIQLTGLTTASNTQYLSIDTNGFVYKSPTSGLSTSITINSTPIISGVSGRILYQNSSNFVSEAADLTFDGTYNQLTVNTIARYTGNTQLDVYGATKTKHLVANYDFVTLSAYTPTISGSSALGDGSPTAVIYGTDLAGYVTLTPDGTISDQERHICRVFYNNVYDDTTIVMLTNGSETLGINNSFITFGANNYFDIFHGSSSLSLEAAKTYVINYHVIGLSPCTDC